MFLMVWGPLRRKEMTSKIDSGAILALAILTVHIPLSRIMRHSLFLTAAAYMILRVEALRMLQSTMPVMMTLNVSDVDTIDYVYELVYPRMNISNLRLSALNLSRRLCTLLTQDMCGRPWTVNDYQIQPGATILATSGTLQPWSPQPPFNSDTPGRDRRPPPLRRFR